MKKMIIIVIAACALLTGCMSAQDARLISEWAEQQYMEQAKAIREAVVWSEDTSASTPERPYITAPVEPAPTPSPELPYITAPVEPAPTPTPSSELPYITAPVEPAPTEQPAVQTPTPAPAEPMPELPYITAPVEPDPTSKPELPYITAPVEPSAPPSIIPAPTEPPAMPTPVPTEPAPTPDPVETPPAMPEPTPAPAGGYAICSCGATLTPDELVGHMKAHALNGESHSYTAN